MYFHLERGVETNSGVEPCCHKDDGVLFFEIGGAMISITMDNVRAGFFADLLSRASKTEDYQEMMDSDIVIALEDEDEETRNLIIAAGMGLIFNLEVKVLQPFADWIREKWEIAE